MAYSKRDILDTEEMLRRLERLGISRDDAEALRRISMTLHRWHELECGCDNGAIEREGDDMTGRPYWYNPVIGRGFRPHYIPDREKGAIKRLNAIMAQYPSLTPYVQGDPRGASLYILKPGDVPEGQHPESYYNRGVAVHR